LLRKTPIAIAALLALGSADGLLAPPAAAQAAATNPAIATAASDAPATALPPLTNTATRTDRPVDAVPATVTVLPAREIEAVGARDLQDLLRNEVDLSVRAAPGRFGVALAGTGRAGVEGINIRGLQGNQVLMLVDGIRVPGSFSFGALATGRGDYLALEATAAAEVLRGPASASFGSDGLAGALSLRTLDPADVLRPGATAGGFVRLGASQLDDSVVLTGAVATRQSAWEALLLASERRGHETRNQGDNEALDSTRTAPNPLDYRQRVLLGKLFLQPDASHRLGLTLEAVHRRLETDVISARAVLPPAPAAPPATAVIGLQARDRVERERVSVEHRYDDLNGRWFQKAATRLYTQTGQTRQFGEEDRFTAADRTRDSRYRERVVGLSTQFESQLAGAASQRLSYGLDTSRTRITALRDGTPNPSAPPPRGENFPVKPFPDTDYTLFGAFVQSEIELAGAGGATRGLTLIPALRYDRYALDPSPVGYTGGEVVALSDDALTPRLGLLWRLNEAFVPYAQWSRAFRAPMPGQVNNGFTNVAAGYRSIGNPDLQAEKARGIELGLRGQAGGPGQTLRWQLAAYDNRYRDFISQEVVSGRFTPADPAIFQFINLAQARIRGVELRGEWQFARAWRLSAAHARTRGSRTVDGTTEPLATIEPAKTALGLRWTEGPWALRADLLRVQAKDPARIAAAGPPAFAPGGYTVLDLGLRWQMAPRWTLIANLNNLGDETYWRWSDVRGLPDTSAVKDAYTAPGRHWQLALRHDF
jgi:hemoglobin/transferrin/lactoferrin receptor protein